MSVNMKLKSSSLEQLFQAILLLESVEECYELFEDLCTVTELKALAQRLEVARLLEAGESYEDIVEITGASTATISRVKRCLLYGADGYALILKRLKEKQGKEEGEPTSSMKERRKGRKNGKATTPVREEEPLG